MSTLRDRARKAALDTYDPYADGSDEGRAGDAASDVWEPEYERLRAEIHRLQRALIDADVLTDCEDLCLVVCAGPCGV